MRGKILVVDDAEVNRNILCVIFQSEYEVIEAENGKVALDLLEEHKDELSVILLDLHMPVMDGFEFMDEMKKKELTSQIPIILITGDESHDSEKAGYQSGASDFIRKPFDPQIVKMRVGNIVELFKHKNHLEDLVEAQTSILKKQSKQLKDMNDNLIETLSTVVEFRNLESGQHIKRIRYFTEILLKAIQKNYPEYELTDQLIEIITSASAMHDVGKIAIPDVILLKPGRLTSDEFEIMKTHTTRGCDIIERVASIQGEETFYDYCYDICRYHHERFDGHGYPDGLVGDEIPIAAQAVSVADVYDALVSERVYKAAYSKETAFKMIQDGECGVFSPKLMQCLCLVKKDFEELSDKYREK